MTEAANNQKPRSRWVLKAAMVVVLFSCCGCPPYYMFLVPWLDDIRVKRLKADLEERLPNGSTREQAEAWFAARGLTDRGVDYGDMVRVPKDGEPRSGVWSGMWGTITLRTFPMREEIHIELHFDDNGKVRARSVRHFS